MTPAKVLEPCGALFGIAGAYLLSSTLEFANLGWVLFGISGVALAAMAYLIRAYWLLAMQLCFCWTNGRGIWNKVIGADSLPPELATKLQALVAWASSLLS